MFPARIFANADTISYIYDASGTKLATVAVDGSLTLYRTVMTYARRAGQQVDELQYIAQPEGLVAPMNGVGGAQAWEYRYFKTDHTGSTRVVLAASGAGATASLTAVQTTDYYPFGMAHGMFGNLDINRYLYGGKEYQDGVLNGSALGLYDFHARYYDPVLGRWFNVDPALQLVNPYLYCANSPMMFVDPDGEFITFSFNKHGFSVGLNFGFGGFGINVGWDDGGSFGVYGEVGPRFGPVGITSTVSFDYGFRSNSVSMTTGAGVGGTYGPFNAGLSGSYTHNLSTGQGGFNWGVGGGVGIYGNNRGGISINASYGPGGWTFGASGNYDPRTQLRYVTSQDGELVRQDSDLGRYVIRKPESGIYDAFRSEDEAYTYMWEASHKSGYAYKEHAAYVLSDGRVVMLPIINNTSTKSYAYVRWLKSNGDGTYRLLHYRSKVVGYTHTHPGSTFMEVSQDDIRFMHDWSNIGIFKTIANGGIIYQSWGNCQYLEIGAVK